MTSPTVNPERRQTPRSTLTKLAYINLESDNGAIVLNVSDGGLCFHSFVPIPWSETIRFWFSEQKHRIEVEGKLAWMDKAQKKGGMQFTNLSTEARLQISDWMNQAAKTAAAGTRLAPSLSSPSESHTYNISSKHINAVHDSPFRLEVRSPKIKVPARLRGFSGGLVLGILVSTLVVTGVLLHSYRRQFGNILVHLGEQLGARPQPQTAAPVRERASAAPASNPSPAKLPAQSLTKPAEHQKVTPAAPGPLTTTRAPTPAARPASVAPGILSGPQPTPSLKTTVETEASGIPGKVGTAPKIESANHPSDHIEVSSANESGLYSTTYLEIGKFHDIARSELAMEKLKQLGFGPTVVHTGHLWMSTYQVLVGPYSNDHEVKAAHKFLTSRGFRPRAYERGSHSFTFPAGLTFQGIHIPLGDCVVSWEAYVNDATVKFEKDGSVIATTEGKLARRADRYSSNAIVYQKKSDGSRTLLEIRFAGMNQVLVFGKAS